MNRNEDAVLNRLLRIIESKTSWGKNELKMVICDLAVDQLSQPMPIAPKPSKPNYDAPTPKLTVSFEDLPPF